MIKSYFLFILIILSGLFNSSLGYSQQESVENSISRDIARARDVIKEIVVVGNRKIEQEAVRARLNSSVGDIYSKEKVKKDVQALFESGFFYNVTVDLQNVSGGVRLTYAVLEKPSIVEIGYSGNDEIDTDDLVETSNLKVYEILDYGKLNDAVKKIEKLYEEKGFFLARVTYEVVHVQKDETVKVEFKIQENDMVVVKKIRLIGNKKIPSSILKGHMQTKEGGFFSFISGGGSYKQEAFDQDISILNFAYFNEGYVQVKIDRPQVYVSPDKKGIYITIRIEEGEQFEVGSVDFSGDILFSREEMLEKTLLKEGDVFSSQTLQKDILSLQAMYGDLGYAFANPIPRTRVIEKERKIEITYEIDKGQKVYIGEINVTGNSKTRDKVVRRELKIREGELYNETRKRESIANVKRLGFFDTVSFNTSTPEDNPSQLDIDIVVKERNTGTIQVGAGYSTYSGFVFNGQVKQTNLLGRGQNLGVSLNLSDKESLFNLNFTEPYFMDTEWSVGVDAYQSNTDKIVYNQIKRGGAVRVGHPLAPYLNGYIRYKLDDTELELNPDEGDPAVYPVSTANGTTSSLTFTLTYDKRNDRFAPTEGAFANASFEYAGLGGDKKYNKGGLNLRYYKDLFWNVVWRNNITFGVLNANDPGAPYPDNEPPFNERFLLGGANTLRGYQFFTIGKRVRSQIAFDKARSDGYTVAESEVKAMRPFGGKQQFYYNLEFQFPLIDEAGIMGVMFYDIGDAQDVIDFDNLRSNYGFGFRWFSPIGPLRFEWGFPIGRQEELDESPMNFQFAIGTPF